MTGPAPLSLADQGFFWLNAELHAVDNALVAAGQMFVQYQVPADAVPGRQIVFVHGGGCQGLDFLGTPDGRPGWSTYFLRRGWAVYVVDRPGHGRSPYIDAVYGPKHHRLTADRCRAVFSAPPPDAWPEASLHTQWPGDGTSDETFLSFAAGTSPLIADGALAESYMRPAGTALLERIGPSVVLTHSIGALFGWQVCDSRPDLVRAHVAVEPLGPAFDTGPLFSLDWGLTTTPVAYEPPISSASELAWGPRPWPDGSTVALQLDPPHQLSRIARVPTAVVTSEASYRARLDPKTVAFLSQAGVPVEHLKLPELGIFGNGHMMMLERNSDDIAAAIDGWLSATLAH